jgi:hypothetical protein
MLAAVEAVSLHGWHLDFIDPGPERITARAAGNLVSFSDLDLGVAFSIGLRAYPNLPAADALSLEERVRSHVKVLNNEAIASATQAAPIFSRARIGHDAYDQEPE